MIAMSAPPVSSGCCIAAVVRETAAHGWPHAITQAEAAGVTRKVFAAQHLTAGGGLCHFGASVGRGWCGIVPSRGMPYRVNFRVFEDGSWVARRVAS